MALAQEDLIQIQQLIEQTIAARPEVINSNVRYELDLRERMVRVEEELKHQRELIQQSIENSNKRFEQVDKRFEQVDKRFEQLLAEMNKRFEQVDKRFEQIDKQVANLINRVDRFMFWSLGLTISAVFVVIKFT
jgi:uncharacterized protein YukE